MNRLNDDRGFIAIWLIKLAIPFAIIAFLLLEVGGAVISRTQAQDLAGQAATEANIAYFNARTFETAEARAKEFVQMNGMTFESLTIDPNAQTLSVTVAKQAPSLVLKRFAATRRFTDIHVTQSVPIRR